MLGFRCCKVHVRNSTVSQDKCSRNTKRELRRADGKSRYVHCGTDGVCGNALRWRKVARCSSYAMPTPVVPELRATFRPFVTPLHNSLITSSCSRYVIFFKKKLKFVGRKLIHVSQYISRECESTCFWFTRRLQNAFGKMVTPVGKFPNFSCRTVS